MLLQIRLTILICICILVAHFSNLNELLFIIFRWQDYEANLGSGFRELRKDNEFMDVTLCCDNGVDKVQAHKLILVSWMKILFVNFGGNITINSYFHLNNCLLLWFSRLRAHLYSEEFSPIMQKNHYFTSKVSINVN